MMIANVITLGLVLFVLFLFYTDVGEYAVFFVIIDALFLAAAIGFMRCQQIVALMAIRETFDYSLWSAFAGLLCGSVMICICVLVSFSELDFGRYDF